MPDTDSSLSTLLDGVRHFSAEVFPSNRKMFSELARGQAPHTLFITCADSRVSPGMITQSAPGNLFNLRNIGNIVPAYGEMLGGVSAAIEYAVVALGVSHIIVCGHSDCGAMKAMIEPHKHGLERMPTVASWLRNAEAARAVTQALLSQSDARESKDPAGDGARAVTTMAEQNVLLQLSHLRTHPAVAARLADGRLQIQGWLYDIASGTVRILDELTRSAISLQEAQARLQRPPG
ncbi:carbonic anhydrase [Lichenicoccus sp.]|uniref:carbonic anhydrase n=1 Tax=Lichenicoccus sp. TaxID=2781899 RepID=UPI003D152B4D